MPDFDNFPTPELQMALDELNAIWAWLAESPSGEAYDLHGLDTAMQVLSRIIEARLDATWEVTR